jgi:transposase InsO family protein
MRAVSSIDLSTNWHRQLSRSFKQINYLKKEATKPAAANFLQQQARFDKFIEVFNNERPHEALDMKCPAEVYQPSPRLSLANCYCGKF